MNDYTESLSGLLVPHSVDSRQQQIVFLVKFVNKTEHVDNLLDGKLHAQRLAAFRQLDGDGAKLREDDGAAGRRDRDEGTSSWLQPGRGHLVINGRNLTPDLAGPVQIQPDWLSQLNVYCMHAAHADETAFERAASGDVEYLRQQLRIPERCMELGSHAVVVTDIPEFMRRFGAAIASNGYRAWSHLVRYFDPASFHGQFDGIDGVFRKRAEYSYQREYRFAIQTGTAGSNPVQLNIGDIRDITLRFDSMDLNSAAFLGGDMRIEIGSTSDG